MKIPRKVVLAALLAIGSTASVVALLTIGSPDSTVAMDCCGGGGMAMTANANCHPSTATAKTNSTDNPTLSQPVQAALDNYLKVQSTLAKDSLEGLPEAANAIATAIGDGTEIPATVAQQAKALANAKDINAAREALKPLSKSLIDYLKTQNALAGTYKEAFCPMANASWIQTEPEITNPYMGKVMLHCGQFKS